MENKTTTKGVKGCSNCATGKADNATADKAVKSSSTKKSSTGKTSKTGK